ncbi:MAG: hypothetical protein O7B81_12560 [Gammaproteobacteria bacterium]|nr:hypothetical protein [Gammaproteobacteria bacterium]
MGRRRGAVVGHARLSIEPSNGDGDAGRAPAHSPHQTTLAEREIVDRRAVASGATPTMSMLLFIAATMADLRS